MSKRFDLDMDKRFEGDPFYFRAKLLHQIQSGDITDSNRKKVIDRWISYAQKFSLGYVLYRQYYGDHAPSIEQLWVRAYHKQDRRSLFQLLRVFKTLAGAKWVVYRLRSACATGSIEFIQKFGEALAAPCKVHGNTNTKQIEYLVMNWFRMENPLCEMSTREIWHELKREDIIKAKGHPSKRHLKALDKRTERLDLPKGKGVRQKFIDFMSQ